MQLRSIKRVPNGRGPEDACEAIGSTSICNQGQSRAIKGNQGRSVASIGNQGQSKAIKAIGGNQGQSRASILLLGEKLIGRLVIIIRIEGRRSLVLFVHFVERVELIVDEQKVDDHPITAHVAEGLDGRE